MSSKPNCNEFYRTALERACVDAIESLEKNYGTDMKFVVIGITKNYASICTSPMSTSATLEYLKQAAVHVTSHPVPTKLTTITESTSLYLDDANEVP
jgi:hypothetical protein